MALSQFEKIKINEYLQGYVVDSYEELIPSGKSVRLNDLLDILLKFFDKGLENKRKESFLLNCLIGIKTCVDELSDCGYGVEQEFIDQIFLIKRKYDEYAKKCNISNPKLENIVKEIDNFIFMNDLNDDNDELDNEAEDLEENSEDEESEKEAILQKIASSFTDLNKENQSLREENERLKKLNKASKKDLNSKTRQLNDANTKYKALKNQQKDHDNQVSRLHQRVVTLTTQLDDSKRQLQDFSLNSRMYENQKAELKKLRDEVDKYHQKDKILVQQIMDDNQDLLINRVKKAMINIMMNKECTFDEIERELLNRNIILMRKELFDCFKEIREEYQVDVNIKNNGVITYHIATPILTSNKRFSFSSDNNILDIMLTADWHLYSLDDKAIKKVDVLYEYCAKNNINIIFNLGDFIDINFDHSLADKRAKLSYEANKRLEKLATVLPYDAKINQYIMGGNHDEYLRRVKLDVIESLAMNRPDIYSLGYNHAFVDINNSTIALHHPDRKYNLLKEYREYLTTYYNTNNTDINYEDIYMNLFGHFHIFKYFHTDGYLSVPSLTRDAKGAVHLRIHFGKNAKIIYVEIIPLTYTNGLKSEKAMKYTKEFKPKKGHK